MNKNVELINYIDVAETVYERVYENNKISNNLIVNLNRIMAEIKNQAAEKRLKLKYSSIDFEHCLSLPLADRKIKVDLSLIPHFEDREERANSNMRCDSLKSLMIINKLSKFL